MRPSSAPPNKKELSRGDLAGNVNFPTYAVKMLTDRHFVVAGGGGSASTGVANGFVSLIIRVPLSSPSMTLSFFVSQATFQLTFNGEKCVATEVGRHNTGGCSVMCCSSYEDKKGKLYFVAGLDDRSQLYFFAKRMELARSLSYSDQNENGGSPSHSVHDPTCSEHSLTSNSADKSPERSTLRHRQPSSNQNGATPQEGAVPSPKKLRIVAMPMDNVRTDTRWVHPIPSLHLIVLKSLFL